MSANGPSERKFSYTALGLALGLMFGGILGLIADNLVVFIGGGMVLGLALGFALEHRAGGMT